MFHLQEKRIIGSLANSMVDVISTKIVTIIKVLMVKIMKTIVAEVSNTRLTMNRVEMLFQ